MVVRFRIALRPESLPLVALVAQEIAARPDYHARELRWTPSLIPT
jgi:hypothetical protein